MKKMVATGFALTSVLALLASPAVAAPPKHRAPVAHDTMAPSERPTGQSYARQSDIVTLNGQVIGVDPDANIRTQLLHDPAPNEY